MCLGPSSKHVVGCHLLKTTHISATVKLLCFSAGLWIDVGEWPLPLGMTAVWQDPQIKWPLLLLGRNHTESSNSSIYWGKGSESLIRSHPRSSRQHAITTVIRWLHIPQFTGGWRNIDFWPQLPKATQRPFYESIAIEKDNLMGLI